MLNQQAASPLNSEQAQIVNHVHGPIFVIAPVGTGKTRVLAERVVNAIEHGIPAEKILCLTFTNRAAQEMRARLKAYDGKAARLATIKTFHALCMHMLQIEARQIGLPADFIVYDDVDSLELIKAIAQTNRDKDAKEIFYALSNCKRQAQGESLKLVFPSRLVYQPLASHLAVATRYQEILQQRHALDFADLIYFTRAMLVDRPDIRARWEQRYDFVQVDEVQDTEMAEYEIVQLLARCSRNLAMIGDVDQTIYGWRGSVPDVVLSRFCREFQPKRYPLTFNYRATKVLIGATDSFAGSFQRRYSQVLPAPGTEPGESISVHQANNPRDEALWIGQQVRRLAQGRTGFAYNRLAVLTRTNKRGMRISQVFQEMGIPHLTVEEYEFFRRQEVKDILAYLRLLVNPYDTGAVHRILQRPARGIGESTINAITQEGEACGLKLIDFLDPCTLANGDPYGELLHCFGQGQLVVFDLETTGLSPEIDEIVEIAAMRMVNGQPAGQFHKYLRNRVPVGDSQQVHGYSNQFLATHGEDPRATLQAFLRLTQGMLFVGHNIGYDIKMLTSYARRLGLSVGPIRWIDTWNMSTRFLEAPNYRLETLAKCLRLANRPDHSALQDVRATIDLLDVLVKRVMVQPAERQRLINRYRKNFVELAEQVARWRAAATSCRPAQLMEQILEESGLCAYYAGELKRSSNLETLVRIFQEAEPTELHPETALRTLLEYTALAKNVDILSSDSNQIPVITIHQAKGLEFDTVFIAGAVEREMPDYRSASEEQLLEEQHVFYVALTRAKKHLFISGHGHDDWGDDRMPSRFIQAIKSEYLCPC